MSMSISRFFFYVELYLTAQNRLVLTGALSEAVVPEQIEPYWVTEMALLMAIKDPGDL